MILHRSMVHKSLLMIQIWNYKSCRRTLHLSPMGLSTIRNMQKKKFDSSSLPHYHRFIALRENMAAFLLYLTTYCSVIITKCTNCYEVLLNPLCKWRAHFCTFLFMYLMQFDINEHRYKCNDWWLACCKTCLHSGLKGRDLVVFVRSTIHMLLSLCKLVRLSIMCQIAYL